MHIKKIIYFLALSAILFISCKPVEQIRYVEIPKIEYRNVVQKEQVHDSVYITEREYIAGDTIYIKSVEYRYRDRVICDTVVVQDSVIIKKEIPVEVKVKYVPQWVKILATIGLLAIAAFILFMALRR